MTDLAWTSKESIAIDLILDWLKECRINRTPQEYLEIEAKLPKLEAAFTHVNARLAEMQEKGVGIDEPRRYEICYFKKGDRGHYFVPFPSSLSRETIRKAIRKYRDQAAYLRQLIGH